MCADIYAVQREGNNKATSKGKAIIFALLNEIALMTLNNILFNKNS